MSDKNKKEEAKKWFSRRHQTSEAHLNAHDTYLTEHGPDARKRKASERQEVRNALTPAQQIAVLNQRLGVGQGAVKERTRLRASPQPQSLAN